MGTADIAIWSTPEAWALPIFATALTCLVLLIIVQICEDCEQRPFPIGAGGRLALAVVGLGAAVVWSVI